MREQQIQIIEGKLEFQDYLDMVRLVNKRGRYLIYGFFSFSILMDIVTKSVSAAITILILWSVYEIYLRLTSKKAFQSYKNYHKEKVTNITVEGIELTTMDSSFHSITKWDEFCEVKENEKLFYLMTSSNGGGHFFFKKKFNPEQLIQFKNLIKNMLDAKLFVKVNPLKYLVFGVLIRIAFMCLSVVLDRSL